LPRQRQWIAPFSVGWWHDLHLSHSCISQCDIAIWSNDCCVLLCVVTGRHAVILVISTKYVYIFIFQNEICVPGAIGKLFVIAVSCNIYSVPYCLFICQLIIIYDFTVYNETIHVCTLYIIYIFIFQSSEWGVCVHTICLSQPFLLN